MRSCKCGTILETKAPQCKECSRNYMNARRKAGLEAGLTKYDVYNYEWRTKNPEAYLIHMAKSRAKKKGWEFNLEASDISIPDICPVLGCPLFIQQGKSGLGKNPYNPSLDRIDSNLGYVKGNVRVISWRANDLKKNGTLEEFTKLVEYLHAIYEERKA